MLALDAHPKVAAQARAWTATPERSGLTTVEAETATATTGTVVKADPAWTGESEYSGGQFLRLDTGEQATIDLGASDQRRVLEPVSWQAGERSGGQSVDRGRAVDSAAAPGRPVWALRRARARCCRSVWIRSCPPIRTR